MIAPKVGEVSGVQADGASVRSYEENVAMPSLEFIRAVAELLETEPDTLLADRAATAAGDLRRADQSLIRGSTAAEPMEYARGISGVLPDSISPLGARNH
jgi:hypothetical protein